MEAYGFADWDGNDRHFMGWAGTGVHFDPIIASNAAHWLSENAGPADDGDRAVVPDRGPGQPPRRDVVPGGPARLRGPPPRRTWPHIRRCWSRRPGRTTRPCRSTGEPYPEVCDTLPANFADPLHAKPEAHRQWRWDQQHGLMGLHRPVGQGVVAAPPRLLRPPPPPGRPEPRHGARRPRGVGGMGRHRHHLHLRPRRHVRLPRPAVQGPVRLRRDHAGAALREGAGHHHPGHGDLGPRLPRRPGRHHLRAGRRRPGHVGAPPCRATDLTPVLADPTASVRDHILFAQDSAQTTNLNTGPLRAARLLRRARRSTPATTGSGGGKPGTGLWGRSPGHKLFDVDCAFDDNDHEWYDHGHRPPRAGEPGQRPGRGPAPCASSTSACWPTSGSRSSPFR